MIRFEVSTIADAMKKAARVSPKPKSLTSSYSSGILITYSEQHDAVVIASTDQNVWYRQHVNSLQIRGTGQWRVPISAAAFLDTLPKRGSEVVLETELNMLTMTRTHGRGKTQGTVPLLPVDDFPRWEPFPEDTAQAINKFATGIESVSWAAADEDNGVVELSGVYLDGTHAFATNRFVAAKFPLNIPNLSAPITIPSKILASVIHHAGDVLLCETEMGLGIAPDEWTQISVQKFGRNVHTKLRLPTEFTDKCRFSRDEFKDTVTKLFSVVKPDKGCVLTLIMGNNKIIIKMSGEVPEEKGTSYIEAETTNDIPVTLKYNPNFINDTVSKATGDHVNIHYNSNSEPQFTYVTSGAGYQGWVAPLNMGGS